MPHQSRLEPSLVVALALVLFTVSAAVTWVLLQW